MEGCCTCWSSQVQSAKNSLLEEANPRHGNKKSPINQGSRYITKNKTLNNYKAKLINDGLSRMKKDEKINI